MKNAELFKLLLCSLPLLHGPGIEIECPTRPLEKHLERFRQRMLTFSNCRARVVQGLVNWVHNCWFEFWIVHQTIASVSVGV
jgi:hypothetical protein